MTDSQTSPRPATDRKPLTIGNVSLDLAFDENTFLGIGEIRTDKGDVLRSGARAMSIDIRSPDGVELLNWRLIAITPNADGTVELLLHCDRRDAGPMEYMLHSVRPRLNTADWSRAIRPATGTELRLRLWPVERTVGGRRFSGFAYQYHFNSPDIAIYKILDRSTWEIGGKASGNQIWMRGAEPTIFSIKSPADYYSSEWYLPGIANPNIFQFKPLQTHLQGFTFTASPAGVLVTWASEVHHVRTLIQKDVGSERIVHLHESCGDLATEINSAPIEVLYWDHPAPDSVDLINCYEDVRDLVHEHLHRQIGMRRERVTTTGMIEEWTVPDMDRYTDQGVPQLGEVGVKTIEIANHFQNNMNVYGVGNMCCTIDLKVADSVGEGKLQRFCEVARENGMAVRMWGNTAVTTLSSVFFERMEADDRVKQPVHLLPKPGSPFHQLLQQCDALVCDASGSFEADHYRPRFAVLNLRSDAVRNYWIDAWRDAHDRIGISGIFLDSSFNLSSDKHHWCQNPAARRAGGATADQAHLLIHQRPREAASPVIQSQYLAHLALMAEMQKMGYSYCAEDHGVFGIHRAGWNLSTNIAAFHLWADSLQSFDVPTLRSLGADLDAVFLEGLAYRVMWLIHWNPAASRLSFSQSGFRPGVDEPSERQLRLLKVYNEVEPWMVHRTVLPNADAVLYRSDDVIVIWALKDTQVALPEGRHAVRDVTGNIDSIGVEQVQVRGGEVFMVRLNAADASDEQRAAKVELSVHVNKAALSRRRETGVPARN